MKNRQAAILTGMFLCMAAVTGCGSNTETQAANSREAKSKTQQQKIQQQKAMMRKRTGKQEKRKNKIKKIRFSVRLFRYLRTPLQFL